MPESKLFYHFIAGSILFLGLVTSILLCAGVFGLWEAGFEVFIVVISVLGIFGWLTHKLAVFLYKTEF